MDRSKYYIAAIAAFSIWGFFSLALRPLHNYAAIDILFYRVFLCVILLFGIAVCFRRSAIKNDMARYREYSNHGKRIFIGRNVLSGLLLSANWFFFIYVMNNVSVKATSLAYLVCPILTAVLAGFLLKEKLARLQWLSLIIATMGCLLLALGHYIDLLLSVVIALSYAIYLVIQKKNAGFDNLLMLLFHIVVAASALAPFYPLYGSLPQEPVFYGYIVVIAVGFTILPLLLNLFALKGISSASVGMLLNINPLIAFGLAIWKFGEKTDSIQITGYSIICVSVLLFNLPAIMGKKQV